MAIAVQTVQNPAYTRTIRLKKDIARITIVVMIRPSKRYKNHKQQKIVGSLTMIKEKKTSLTALIKARSKFELFRTNLTTEQEKAGAIQAFEYCFELSWKSMHRIIKKKTTKPLYGPRDIFRESALAGLIDNPEIWFDFMDSRNLTSRTYEEDVAEEVISLFPAFSKELEMLIFKLQEKENTAC